MMSRRRKQQGFAMFAVTAAIAIATTALIAYLPFQIERAETLQAEVSATRIFTLGDVAIQFRIDQGAWPGEAAGCTLAQVNADLVAQGYLTAGLTQTAWGSPLDTSCTPARFDVAADAPRLVRAEQAASFLHTARVTVPADDPVNYDARVTSEFPAGGAPAFGQVLHRVVIPGRPELNQMATALDMTGNDIVNAGTITASQGAFDSLSVSGNSQLCTAGAPGCAVSVNPNAQFTQQAGGDVNLEMTNNGRLIITSPGGGGDLTVNGVLRAPNQTILANQGLEWGNGSRLTSGATGDLIELGGNNAVAGNGTPGIDFHFQGLTEDFNVRFWNSANRVMSLSGSGGNLATLLVEGDGIYTNNLQVVGNIGARDVVSSVSNKSLSQAVQTKTIVPAGTVLPVPSYCDTLGLIPQIYTAINQVAEGPVATPLYQAATYAIRSGAQWTVHVKLVTESGIYDSGNGTMPAAARPYNQVDVSIKCERA